MINKKDIHLLKNAAYKDQGNRKFQRVHDHPSEKYLYSVDRDGNRMQVFDKNGT
jgi:hypothetical protein